MSKLATPFRPLWNGSQWFREKRNRPKVIALGAALTVAAIAGVTTWALWPEPPRQREYLDATACLLTGEKGVAGEAAPVWSALQEASAAGLVRVQYLAVQGPQTGENASVYLNSLAGNRCGAIVAVGAAPAEAVTKSAGAHAGIRFLTVGAAPAAQPDNVEAIPADSPDALRTAVRQHIDELAEEAS